MRKSSETVGSVALLSAPARPDLDQVQLGPSGRAFIGSIMRDWAPAGCGLRGALSLYLVVRWAMCAWVSTPAPKWEASAAVD